MPFELNLRKYFTPEAIVATMTRLPELKTPIMDLLFSDVRNIPRPVVGAKDLGLNPENLPVVRRGTHSYPMKASGGSITLIEPQPVNPSEFISGADLNNLRSFNETSIQQEIDNIIDRLRRGCRATAEALAIQSLTGKIAYWLQGEGGVLEDYEVEYGSIGDASADVPKKFDATGAKISDVIKAVEAIVLRLKAQGVDGNDVLLGCGFDVFAVLCDLVGDIKNSSIAVVSTSGISFGGGFTIQLLPQTYRNLETRAADPVIPAKHLLVVDKGAGHKMLYAGLDSLGAGQQALPFYADYEEKKDPSGVNVIAESKPLPVVNVKGLIKAQVLT
ncbi:MAG TPA: major capsid protein [Spirochaetales bacterium]|nr:major capsid protein [Spirochaetales bacterium]